MTVTAALLSTSLPEALSPLTQFGGLSLLKRALLTAQRCGARTCYVLIDKTAQEELQGSLFNDENDTRLTARVVWVPHFASLAEAFVERLPAGEGHCLVFSCDTLFRPALVQMLAQNAGQQDKAGQEGKEERWQVHGGTNNAVLSLVPLAQLPTLLTAWKQGRSLQKERGGKKGKPEGLNALSPGEHFFYRLTAQNSLAKAEKTFLFALENPRDGLVDTYLNRKFSRLLTRFFLRTPLTPNQITVLSFLTGLIGASCFLLGSYAWAVAGALLLQFSTVMDCVDGEVARVKMLESPFGARLDISLDTVVHIAIFLGVGVAVWKQDGLAAAPLLGGMLAAAACISFPLITIAEKTEEQGRQRAGWADVWLDNMVAGVTSRDYSLLVLLCAIAGKLAWFLWAAAIGAQVFWLTLVLLLYQADRLRKSVLFASPPEG